MGFGAVSLLQNHMYHAQCSQPFNPLGHYQKIGSFSSMEGIALLPKIWTLSGVMAPSFLLFMCRKSKIDWQAGIWRCVFGLE